MQAVLYDYWRSSASYRVRIALNLAGIAYEGVVVDLLARDHKGAAHLARNPQGFVPVLEIDGHRFTQSLAILEYLDETRAIGLLPKDPAARAQQRALAQSLAVDVHPVCNLSVVGHVAGLAAQPEGAKEAWMRHFIEPGLAAFEGLLAEMPEAPFCGGEAPGLADLCLVPQIYNADRWGADYSDCPRLRAVLANCAAHPAFVAATPEAVHKA